MPHPASEQDRAVSANAGESVNTPRPRGGSGVRAAAVCALVLAVFFLPALGPGQQFVYRDTGRMHAPTKRFVAEELRRGHLPAWNPYAGLGAPVVAGSVDAALHPFNLLLAAAPFELAFKLWVLLSFLAAALGAYAWTRALGASPPAATTAGLIFALSGPLVSSSDNLQYLTTYAALPWMLASVHRFVGEGGPLALALTGLASVICLAGGDPQAWGFAVVVAPVYAITVAGAGPRRGAVGRGLGAAGVAIAAAAVVVIPVGLWFTHTSRSGGLDAAELARWNLHPARLIELVLPSVFRGDPDAPISAVHRAYLGGAVDDLPWFLSIYLGAAAAVLAGVAAVERRAARWLLVLAAVFVWAALGPHAGFLQLARELPILGSFRYWEKVTVWPALLLGGGAALGIDAAMRTRAAARRLAVVAAVGSGLGILVWCAAGALPIRGPVAPLLEENLAGAGRHAGLVLLLLALVGWAIARGRLPRAGPLAVGAVVVMDLVAGNAGAYVVRRAPVATPPALVAAFPPGELARATTPFTLREDRWPERGRLESTWEWGRRTFAPTWNVQFHVGSPRVYSGMTDARMMRFEVASQDANRWKAAGIFGVGFMIVPAAPELAGRAGLTPPYQVAAADPELPAYAVRMPHWPRAYVAEDVRAATEEQAFAFASDADGRGPLVALVEADARTLPGGAHGEARITADAPTAVEVRVRADAPALLVLNDAFGPGWRAEVDGAPAPILRVNYLVRGVVVPGGAHLVSFIYETPGLALGAGITAAVAAGLIAWAAARRRRREAAATPTR